MGNLPIEADPAVAVAAAGPELVAKTPFGKTATLLVEELASTAAFADSERAEFWRVCDQLRRLPEADSTLAEFLSEFVTLVSSVYAANAAAIWFWHPETNEFERKADLGFAALGLDSDSQIASDHSDLLHYVAAHDDTLLMSPFSAAARDGRLVRNPTDAFVLLAPIRHGSQTLAIIELFLGPTPIRGRTPELRDRYRQWLSEIGERLLAGVIRRYLASGSPLESAVARLDQATDEVRLLQERIRLQIQQTLQALAGQNFGSLQANQAIATLVHQLLDSKGLRAQCPECGAAAILRCQNTGNAKTGVFVFDHYLESGRTFHGGRTAFPYVEVVPKPPRRKPS